MTIEQELIDSLKTTISVQAELIAQLKLQIESLKASQITISAPSPMPAQPQGTYPPNQQPWVPGSPVAPYPYSTFIYTISGNGVHITSQTHNADNTTSSNVVSMYDAIIPSTPLPVSTEACNGMS
jgi:hypothetical protein